MPGFIDRLNQELESFGRKAQAALDEGKLQLERLRLRREQDEASRQLGMLCYRKARGQEIDPLELDAYLVKLDNLAAAVARVEREIAAAKGEEVSVAEAPPPADVVPAEVVAQD